MEKLGSALSLSKPQQHAIATALQSVPSIASRRSDVMVSDVDLSEGPPTRVAFGELESCALAAAAAPEVLTAVASAGDMDTANSSVASAICDDAVLGSLARSERERRCSAPALTSAIAPAHGTDCGYENAAHGAAAISALLDLGPVMCADAAALGRIVCDVDIAGLADVDAAALVALTSGVLDYHSTRSQCAINGSRASTLAFRSVFCAAETSPTQTCRLDIVVDVLGYGARTWSETRVGYALDSHRVRIASPECGRTVITTFATLLGRPFPTGVLLRAWCHREHAQLPLTAAAVRTASVVRDICKPTQLRCSSGLTPRTRLSSCLCEFGNRPTRGACCLPCELKSPRPRCCEPRSVGRGCNYGA